MDRWPTSWPSATVLAREDLVQKSSRERVTGPYSVRRHDRGRSPFNEMLVEQQDSAFGPASYADRPGARLVGQGSHEGERIVCRQPAKPRDLAGLRLLSLMTVEARSSSSTRSGSHPLRRLAS